MPKTSLRTNEQGQYVIAVDALRTRIARALKELVPYQELLYDHKSCGYVIRTISTGPDHLMIKGPYYFKHFAGLARLIGIFRRRGGFEMPPVAAYDRKGNWYPETPLPLELMFRVVTPALVDMIAQLRGKGYKVSPPYLDTPKPGETVTAAVAPAPDLPRWEDFEDDQQLDDDGNSMGAR